MKKLGTVIRYECITSFPYIWYFYGIQAMIVAFIYAVMVMIGGTDKVTASCFEYNTIVYVGILGILGYNEDFKMLIQNGFIRKYIFLATTTMFLFISSLMALVDTILGNVFHYLLNNYHSFYGVIYGYENPFFNWVWLVLLYFMICMIFYFFILVMNRIGKRGFLYLSILLGGIVMVGVSLFHYALSETTIEKIKEFFLKAMGFVGDGSVNHFLPLLTWFCIAALFGAASYAVIRRIELK